MKAMLLAVASALWLGACSSPPTAMAAAPTIDWICLLPEADGHVGRVWVQGRDGVADGAASGVLEGAYNTARVATGGRLRFVQADAATMEQRYGALLRALPKVAPDGSR